MATTQITRAEVIQVAALAHLELTDLQVASAQRDLAQVLAYVAKLEEVDVTDVEPTTHAVPLTAPTRADEVVETLSRQQVLANAPHTLGGSFAVPRIVDGGN
jgi:aspartyl-tRNA(Asn)/glutamyl-tRNA(Gln) amidotransferase subunit C